RRSRSIVDDESAYGGRRTLPIGDGVLHQGGHHVYRRRPYGACVPEGSCSSTYVNAGRYRTRAQVLRGSSEATSSVICLSKLGPIRGLGSRSQNSGRDFLLPVTPMVRAPSRLESKALSREPIRRVYASFSRKKGWNAGFGCRHGNASVSCPQTRRF